MIVARTIAEVRSFRREVGAASVGFVPTMGYFHEGHLELMRRSRAENERTVVSLYVNPLQFAPHEDLAAYPRDFERDRSLAEGVGVDLLFAPDDDEMYPPALRPKEAAGERLQATVVRVEGLNSVLEGRSRPTHFDGVATVVLKLFHIVSPDRAYFGQKDYQQALLVRRMVADLDLPVDVRVVPTVREPDGLAMSSRNVYLTPEERAQATVLHRALRSAVAAIAAGERDAAAVARLLRETIASEPLARLDYAEVVDAETLSPLPRLAGRVLLAVAARFGRARLIDNEVVAVPGGPGA
ncbi:MAG: pantoate--beta-alanine ligase [Clostridia bacterium]|nr:pantoate--beta-alanine ligase [Clostridia bacterium]